MKKKLLISAMLVAMVLLLAACGCKHEWKEASCTEAKTCQLCGVVEGEALGHAWQDATCEAAKTCTNCQLTEGEALGHNWQEATTEAPKTCSNCQQTEGERIITDARFTTASTLHLQGTWTCDFNMSAEMMGLPMGFENGIDCIMSMEFGNAGDLVTSATLKDEEAFMQDYRDFTLQYTYAVLAQQGIGPELADAAIQQAYGMSMDAYVDASLEGFDVGTLFEAFNAKEVYYVEGDQIHTALTWSSTAFEGSNYTLEDGILTIDALTMEEGGEPMQWQKAE